MKQSFTLTPDQIAASIAAEKPLKTKPSFNKTAAEMVREFHETFGAPIREVPNADIPPAEARLRFALIDEELGEYFEAINAKDIVEIADALGDLLYVVYGAALTYGIDLDAVVDEIHDSNMSKLGEDGKPIYREGDMKVLKGPNFRQPDIARVLGL